MFCCISNNWLAHNMGPTFGGFYGRECRPGLSPTQKVSGKSAERYLYQLSLFFVVVGFLNQCNFWPLIDFIEIYLSVNSVKGHSGSNRTMSHMLHLLIYILGPALNFSSFSQVFRLRIMSRSNKLLYMEYSAKIMHIL